MIRVALIGCVEFTRACLVGLAGARERARDYELVGLMTQPPEATHANSDWCDLGPEARARGVPLHATRDGRDAASLAALRGWAPDLVLVLGWSRLLDDATLALPALGCVGSHPAPLPRGRGRHPLIWTIALGEPRGALTLFRLAAGADTGPILLQRSFDLDANAHATEAYAAMSTLGARMALETVVGLARGTLVPRPQDESRATIYRKRTRADGELRWDQPAARCHALVRALAAPYPGATARCASGELVCRRVAPLAAAADARGEPGAVLACGPERLRVACADHAIDIVAWDGARPRVGEILVAPVGAPEPACTTVASGG